MRFTRANEVDEEQREKRYRLALSNAAALAPFTPATHIDVERDGDAYGFGESVLDRAGFMVLRDDPSVDPEFKRWQPRTQHRRQVLDSLAERRLLGERYPARLRKHVKAACSLKAHQKRPVARCLYGTGPDLGCALYEFLTVTTFTTETLIRAREEQRQDSNLRHRLAENDLAALMEQVPA